MLLSFFERWKNSRLQQHAALLRAYCRPRARALCRFTMTQRPNAYLHTLAGHSDLWNFKLKSVWLRETNLPHYWPCPKIKSYNLISLDLRFSGINDDVVTELASGIANVGLKQLCLRGIHYICYFQEPELQHWWSWSLRQWDQWYYYRVIHKCSKQLQQTEGIWPRWMLLEQAEGK